MVETSSCFLVGVALAGARCSLCPQPLHHLLLLASRERSYSLAGLRPTSCMQDLPCRAIVDPRLQYPPTSYGDVAPVNLDLIFALFEAESPKLSDSWWPLRSSPSNSLSAAFTGRDKVSPIGKPTKEAASFKRLVETRRHPAAHPLFRRRDGSKEP